MKKLIENIKSCKPMLFLLIEITLCIALWVGLFKLMWMMI